MTYDEMAALHAAAFAEDSPWSAAAFKSELAHQGAFAVETPAGFALGRVVLDEAELLTLAVHPDLQGQGNGKALLAQFEAQAREKGASHVFLDVRADNDVAVALYAGADYATAGRRARYYKRADGTYSDAILLTKSLT